MTNDHVVGGVTRLDVTLADGSSYIGDVVAEDPGSDLAVVHIQAPADSSSPSSRSFLLAIRAP